MSEDNLLKNLINKEKINLVANRLKKAYGNFNHRSFLLECQKDLESKELMERITHISLVMEKYLPGPYRKNLKIILKAQGKPVSAQEDPKNDTAMDGCDGFISLIHTEYIARNGLDDFEVSMEHLKLLTQYFSSEFAIRYFIQKDQKKALQLIRPWIKEENRHFRRLVSEGIRPRLPWGLRLKVFCENPKPILPFLKSLLDDESSYVRRSVANCLNDISKDNSEILLDFLEKNKMNKNDKRQGILKHSLRTLEKQGSPRALILLGYNPKVNIEADKLKLRKKRIKMGDELSFNFKIKNISNKTENLLIDYIIHFVKANGKRTPKVFKIKKTKLNSNQILSLSKNHSFKLISTRKYYPGKHKVEIQLNGKIIDSHEFDVC